MKVCIYYDIVLYVYNVVLSKVPTYEGTVRKYESTSTVVLFKFDL